MPKPYSTLAMNLKHFVENTPHFVEYTEDKNPPSRKVEGPLLFTCLFWKKIMYFVNPLQEKVPKSVKN